MGILGHEEKGAGNNIKNTRRHVLRPICETRTGDRQRIGGDEAGKTIRDQCRRVLVKTLNVGLL